MLKVYFPKDLQFAVYYGRFYCSLLTLAIYWKSLGVLEKQVVSFSRFVKWVHSTYSAKAPRMSFLHVLSLLRFRFFYVLVSVFKTRSRWLYISCSTSILIVLYWASFLVWDCFSIWYRIGLQLVVPKPEYEVTPCKIGQVYRRLSVVQSWWLYNVNILSFHYCYYINPCHHNKRLKNTITYYYWKSLWL